MWKFKNKRKSTEELTESITTTTTINERQIVDIRSDDDDDSGNSNSNVDVDVDVDGDDREKNSMTNRDNNNNNNNNKKKQQQDNTDSTVRNNNNIETAETSSTCSSDQDVDALLAKELNSLSFQQRESINDEIHGINVDQIYFDKVKEIEETPELLQESFVKLQIVLNILQTDSFAYNRCQQLYGSSDSHSDSDSDNHGGDSSGGGSSDNNNNKKSSSKRKISSYINTDEFHIIFLRCELFDVTKAARRLIKFVEVMYNLYGDVGIQRRIRLEDLSDQEKHILKLGRLQILPGRDRAGRRIWICFGSNSNNKYTVKSRLGVALYIQMSLADDVETQRKGCVGISWWQNVNIFDGFSSRGKVYSTLSKCGLVRSGAIHTCIAEEELDDNNNYSSNDNSSLQSSRGTPSTIIKSMMALSIGQKLRSKLRFHTGSVMECLYTLQSFGISSNQIPVVVGTCSNKKRRRKETKNNNNTDDDIGEDDDNTKVISSYNHLKLNNHMKWVDLCQLKDNNMKLFGMKWKYNIENYYGLDKQIIACQKLKSHRCGSYNQQIIECPNHSDILSGRGLDIMKHPGNCLLRSIVVSKLDKYINLQTKKEITQLTFDIVHLLKNKYRVRFLKEETIESNGKLGCWFEIPDDQARLKVRVSFRDKINKVQQQQQQQQQTQPKSQRQQQQTQLLKSPPPMQPPILMMAAIHHHHHHHHQIQQQQDQEDTDSNTSIFVCMTGGSSRCVCGISTVSSSTTYTGNKHQL